MGSYLILLHANFIISILIIFSYTQLTILRVFLQKNKDTKSLDSALDIMKTSGVAVATIIKTEEVFRIYVTWQGLIF